MSQWVLPGSFCVLSEFSAFSVPLRFEFEPAVASVAAGGWRLAAGGWRLVDNILREND
ncbi:hypothetical protein AB6N21_001916 [Thiohalocapsa marina]